MGLLIVIYLYSTRKLEFKQIEFVTPIKLMRFEYKIFVMLQRYNIIDEIKVIFMRLIG